MLTYAMLSRGGLVEGIEHYRAKQITVVSNPKMPVLADGCLLSRGTLSVHVQSRALRVMAGAELSGQPAPEPESNSQLSADATA